jgi:hypothetical protein
MGGPKFPVFIALRRMSIESVLGRAPKLMDELHGIGEDDQFLPREAPRHGVLETGCILMFVGDDHRVPCPVRLIEDRKPFEERPEECAKVAEHQPAFTLLLVHDRE